MIKTRTRNLDHQSRSPKKLCQGQANVTRLAQHQLKLGEVLQANAVDAEGVVEAEEMKEVSLRSSKPFHDMCNKVQWVTLLMTSKLIKYSLS